MSALAMGAVALNATEASAVLKDPEPGAMATVARTVGFDWPDEGSGYPGYETQRPEYNYPNYDARYEVLPEQATIVEGTVDNSRTEELQAGASALGGAGAAFGGMWLYRRRRTPAV
jgi:hypothetical protein